MVRAALLLAAAACAVARPSVAAAAPPPPPLDRMIAELDAASGGVATLAGEFSQRNRVKLFKQELTSKGSFYYRRPRQIRWAYTAPDPSTLVLDGQHATLRTPGAPPQEFDLEHDATMRAVFDQLLLWLAPGALKQAGGAYALASSGSAERPTLTLTPRPETPVGHAFTRIELRLDGKSWLVRSILLVEKNGDEKEITFTRLEPNARLPADAFR
jgi:outer membrane lipoprotein-sorting protein